MKKRTYIQGYYTPKNPEKYVGDISEIIYRSSWEKKFMQWCDKNSSVIQWNSEGLAIPYYSKIEDKQRRYFVDFIIKVRSADDQIKTLLIEIKPEAETKPPRPRKRQTKNYIMEQYTFQVNMDKWEAAREFARKHDMKFTILTEYDLGIKSRGLRRGTP